MKNYLHYIKEKNSVINESFSIKDIDKAMKLITDVLKKHISKLLPIPGGENITENNKTLYSKLYIVHNISAFTINWDKEKNEVYSISFFDQKNTSNLLLNGKTKSNLTIYTLGSSIVYFLPIIWTIVNSEKYDISKEEAIKLGRSVYNNGKTNESYEYYIGSLKYIIYENLSNNIIEDTFKLTLEASSNVDQEVKDFKKKKRAEALDANQHKGESTEAKEKNKIAWKDYNEIKNAIDGGATTIEELKLALKHNIRIVSELDASAKKAEKELQTKREDPDMVFKKMSKYINMVIKGLNPSVILCGAPGVGKTYRVKTQLKAHGYNEGHNLHTIKGKCTPRVLYTTLYEYQDKGQIIVIDDADGLVGPKAPEDCINILKGALDSTSDDEGRLVTYGIAGKLVDEEGIPIPKRFYYRGSVIVITNYNAGSLDTALRGRSYIQDIDFTTEEVLEIVKKIMPDLDPEHLSLKSKTKAFDYLTELAKNGTDMEISIRTFGICAKIYEACSDDPDFSDKDAQSMIKEQIELQSARRKGKY